MKLTQVIDGLIKVAGKNVRYDLDVIHVTETHLEVTNGFSVYTVEHHESPVDDGLPVPFCIPVSVIKQALKIRGKDKILYVIIREDKLYVIGETSEISCPLPVPNFPAVTKMMPSMGEYTEPTMALPITGLQQMIDIAKKSGNTTVRFTPHTQLDRPVYIRIGEIDGGIMQLNKYDQNY